MQVREGRVPFRGFETWYRVVGVGEEVGKLPVLCLHGGPGGAHDYLEPLEALARTGRRAVFYDQIGCGRSEGPADPDFYTVEPFVDELGAVREAIGLDRIHLFGSSWGGMLAMEYALTHPDGLAALILASSPASIPQWVEETAKLRALLLPPDVQDTLQRHEAAGTTESPEYEAATTGEHDEATPAINQTLSQGILLSPSYFRTPRTWLTWSTLLRTSPCSMTS